MTDRSTFKYVCYISSIVLLMRNSFHLSGANKAVAILFNELLRNIKSWYAVIKISTCFTNDPLTYESYKFYVKTTWICSCKYEMLINYAKMGRTMATVCILKLFFLTNIVFDII